MYYYVGHKIRNEEINHPNTFIPYFTAYPVHYSYNSKTRGERRKRIMDLNSLPRKIYKNADKKSIDVTKLGV